MGDCGAMWGGVVRINIMLYYYEKIIFSELSVCASVVKIWPTRQALTIFSQYHNKILKIIS